MQPIRWSSHGFRSVLEQVREHIRAWVPVISLAKGLEERSLLRMTEVIAAVLPGHPAGVLSGPNLAREIMSGYAAASVVAMDDETIVCELQRAPRRGFARGIRGLAELARLGGARGGQPQTFAGLAGMGDLVATCMSPQSRNRYVGEQLGKGRTIQAIIDEMHMVAEGVKTSRVVIELAAKYEVETPICREVYRVVHEGSTPTQAYRGLLRVAPGSELDPG
jgi:glycerol-3-phosphate dehydrogenase (NAD(P)+)